MKEEGKISYFAAVLMSINIMVGAGIIYAVAPMTASAGDISFLSWPLISLLLFPVIWSIAQASHLFPGEGGVYHYCSSGINKTVGFLAHWASFLGYLAVLASLATVLRSGIANSTGLSILTEYPIIFNVVVVILYTAINLISVEKISKIQSVATLLKITPILSVIALFAFYVHPNLQFSLKDLTHLGVTVSTGLFAFWGFESCCGIGGLLKDGPKKVGSVILTGFFITTTLYCLFHMGALYIMGSENLALHGAIAFPRFLGISQPLAVALELALTFSVLFSWANSILGVSLANITNLDFLARKKLIVGSSCLSKVNRNQRPVYVALLHGVIFFVMISVTSNTDILFALTNLGVLTSLVLTISAVFLAHLKHKNYIQLAITLLAFFSSAVVGYYSLSKIGSVVNVIPLIFGIIFGLIIYKIQDMRAIRVAQTL
jgi:amino acid transporter